MMLLDRKSEVAAAWTGDFAKVVGACHELKVLYPVVILDSISVMYDFCRQQLSSKVLFHNESMLGYVVSFSNLWRWKIDDYIPELVCYAPPIIRKLATCFCAVLAIGDLRRRTNNRGSASKTWFARAAASYVRIVAHAVTENVRPVRASSEYFPTPPTDCSFHTQIVPHLNPNIQQRVGA